MSFELISPGEKKKESQSVREVRRKYRFNKWAEKGEDPSCFTQRGWLQREKAEKRINPMCSSYVTSNKPFFF